jgi:hypothetical protein
MNFFNSKYILSNKRFGWIDYDRGNKHYTGNLPALL